jgi:SpoVK/Ycf46/Vps4 family AAA+-type ATPase
VQGNDGVLVVGATNRLGLLDDALLRKGRFDLLIYMGRPSTSNRFKILQARAPFPQGSCRAQSTGPLHMSLCLT